MGLFNRTNQQPETTKLNQAVDSLPPRVADWTPEQRQQVAAQSNRAMREQANSQAPKS
ncbi:hypothetical protein [Streptomyces sp. NPDC048242]|uniref:hypothetical protein n=1 Tax=Streptomyces sp. NPDC048242 TaxID=3155026 RepID=UPI003437FBCF